MIEEKRVRMYFPSDKKDRLTGELVGEREVFGLGPLRIDPHTVRYWSRHTKELRGSQVKKAEEFVAHDCVHYMGNNRFVVLPLNTKAAVTVGGSVYSKVPFRHDYNSSDYEIEKRDDNTFECNCQGWQTKKRKGEILPGGANCSHVLALFYSFKMGVFTKGHKV